jgi:hypothetical protein
VPISTLLWRRPPLACFSYFTHTGYHTVDADPLTGGNGEIVEDDPPEHPTSKLDSAIKVFVIALGCFCYGVYKSDPTKSQSHSRTMAPSTNAANSHRIVFTFAMTNLSLTAVPIADSFR